MILSVYSVSATAGFELGEVFVASGQVSIVRQKKTMSAAKGSKLVDGDRVVTGKDSLALIYLYESSDHKLGPDSELVIRDTKKRGILELIKGSIFSRVNPKSFKGKTPLRIKTKAAVSGVRGTEFFVSYGPDKKPDDTWVCVHEGMVEVSSVKGDSKQLVPAGKGVSVTFGDAKVSKPEALAWTQKLNWNFDAKKGSIKNSVDINDAYPDLLDVEYD